MYIDTYTFGTFLRTHMEAIQQKGMGKEKGARKSKKVLSNAEQKQIYFKPCHSY